MLVSSRLDGSFHLPGTTEGPLPYPEVSDFLDRRPSARIIVVIDTHCIQDTGGFLWDGNSAESYKSCELYDVSRGIPNSISLEPSDGRL